MYFIFKRMYSNISIIVAIASNNAIGKDNHLLAYIPGDLKRFKELTTGHCVIMGRRTYESLPNGALPNRTNIVISDIPNDHIEGCHVVRSIEEAIHVCPSDEELFIIGGGSIYRQFMPIAGKLYITRMNKTFEGDTFFPPIEPEQWRILSQQDFPKGEKNDFTYSYIIYRRSEGSERS
jgi:dihydrofolate reductase